MMQSEAASEWKWHDRYARNYKDYADNNGRFWRRYDNDSGPVVEIPRASVVQPTSAPQPTIRHDPRTPRSHFASLPQTSSPVAQSHHPGEQYPISNSPPSLPNQLPPIDTNPYDSHRAARPDSSELSPESPETSNFSSFSISAGGQDPTSRTAGEQIQPPWHQPVRYTSASAHTHAQGTPNIRPHQEHILQPKPRLQTSAIGTTRPEATRQSSSDSRRKKYPDVKGNFLEVAAPNRRRRLSSSASQTEQDEVESSTLLLQQLVLSQGLSIEEEPSEEPRLDPQMQNPIILEGYTPQQPVPQVSNTPFMPTLDENEAQDFRNPRIKSSEGEKEVLDSRYKKRQDPAKFFKEGRVFALLWSEPQGENGTDVSGGYKTRFGQKVYSGIRRMVVVKERKGCCWCIEFSPITTYGGKGTAKPGIEASSHAIIYMSNDKPCRLKSETELTKDPIAIDPASNDQKLDRMSRVHFGKLYTVEHNVKVMPVGLVAKNSMHLLKVYFRLELDK